MCRQKIEQAFKDLFFVACFYAKKDFDTIKKYIYKSFDITLLVGLPMIAGICACSDIFVPKFFGSGYEKVAFFYWVIEY